jgi:hypothetical protein
VKDRAWVETPVDAFVLAKLEAAGLKPAPPADRRTLIRRATFDLTGLPPTPEEVDAFLADRSPGAFEKVVERLLASPQYGEKWGRHWLDVARYADSNGMDENVHYGNAWRYRDYVVAAFNNDKPYDRFIQEQIAGDLLPGEDGPARHERLIATGFLAIGPKVISEVDDQKMLMDAIDEQIDTVGRTVMGLTLGCARCHDHKFDPISTEDYYALAGIFKSTRFMTVMKKPRMWFEHSLTTEADLARKAEHAKQVAARKEAIAAAVAKAAEEAKAGLPAGAPAPKNLEPLFPGGTRADLARMRAELEKLEKDAPEMPAAMGLTEGTVADVPVHIRGSFLTLGNIVPRRFPVVLAGQDQPAFEPGQSGRLRLAQWLASPEHPLTSRVIVNRVWRWHFGQGIVPSTDNFGLLSEHPSHPELLDWLADRFAGVPSPESRVPSPESGGPSRSRVNAASDAGPGIRDPGLNTDPGLGWSIKKLHRLIMLSATYQQGSRPAANPRSAIRDPRSKDPQSVDPENRLLWRANVRRLEAEEIRDALLAAGGLLDRTMGGSILPLKNREYVFDHTSKDQTRYDSRRRSIYIPVIRNHLYDVFHLFDFGDASVPEGSRPATTVAPQALFMMNSELVSQAAEGLAGRVLAPPDMDEAGRIRLMHQVAYGRLPGQAEIGRSRSLLRRFEQAQAGDVAPAARSKQAWAWLSHVVLAANEFIYLR